VNAGDTISRYRIIGRIGKGGMGDVYRAEDTRLERQVALKFLPHEGLTEHAKSRFLNEARAAAKARHPHICPIHDIEEADGELFIVMAYIEGETLRQKIARKPLEPAQVVDLTIQIASGLQCAHALGIVHRDIKSGNIMVDSSGHASILDFGLALAPSALRLTEAGNVVGTPAYMSPEQIEGRDVDARSDLWSLGIVMFEMLTGTVPFLREQSSAIIHAILNDPVPHVADYRAGVPPELQKVIDKALERDASKRWQSAQDMVSMLKYGRVAVPSPDTSATQTIIAPSTKFTRPKRSMMAAAVALGVALVAGGGYAVYRLRPGPVAPAAKMMRQVAILPFEADTEASRSAADGLFEVLSGALADAGRSQGLAVISPGELAARKVTTPEQAHQVYGVDRAIAGSAAASGDKVELKFRLIDAASKKVLAERSAIFDPKDPVVSRDLAVLQVAGMLNLDVHTAPATAGDSGAASAYSAYIEGRGFLARHDLPGNIDRAIASFSSAVKQDPKYALAYAGLGEAYWRKATARGDKQALTLASQNAEYAVELDPQSAIAHAVLGSVYLDTRTRDDAIREFQKALEIKPDNAEAARKLADVYETAGRLKEAEALYIKATESRPTDWSGFLDLGIFYYGQERYPEAEAALNQAKELTPDNELVRQDLAGIYRQHGRYAEAVAEYQQALRIHSQPNLYAGLGGAYFYQHRYKDAVSAVESAIDMDNSQYVYWGNLGIYSKWAPGNESKSAPALRRAIALAEKVAATSKSDVSVHANLAEYRARLGDEKGALAEIAQIPAGPQGKYAARIAIVYELTGHRDQAIAAVRANLKSPASLNQIKDDPDLAAVWKQGKF